MIKLKIYIKKQFASRVVPFYLILNEDIVVVKNAISNNNLIDILNKEQSSINIYPIKANQIIVFNIN